MPSTSKSWALLVPTQNLKISSSKSGMGRIVGLIHSGAKFLHHLCTAETGKQVVDSQNTMVGQA